MAILTKTVSGFMYQELFDSYSLQWEVSPNDFNRIVYENGTIGLEHGDVRISVSIPTPKEDYVFQASITHEPTSLSDIGGIIVSSITDNQIECQTYYNSGAGLNQYYKFLKVCVEGDVYVFHGSIDGETWVYLGNSELAEAHRIGFFLDGIKTSVSKPLLVHEVAVYKSNVITFNFMPPKATIKIIKDGKDVIYDPVHMVKQYGDKVYIDCTTIQMPIKGATIEIYNEVGLKQHVEHNAEICGGDIFELAEDIEFKLNGEPLNTQDVYDLGRLTSKESIFTLTMKNKDISPLISRRLRAEAFSDYYRGVNNASIALVTSTEPVFGKEVVVPHLDSGETIEFLVKIEKDSSNIGPYVADKYKFKLILD